MDAEEIFVLARKSPQEIIVTWYLAREAAERLFDTAVRIANDDESVSLFALEVPDIANIANVRKRAEAAAEAEAYIPLRSHSPINVGMKLG